jgi:ABC-type multidrug transport system fused ATPase/permease subunit
MSVRTRPEWQFFAALHRAAPGLSFAWWLLLVLRGALPVVLGVVSGVLIAAVAHRESLLWPLVFIGASFVALQVFTPVHQVVSLNLGRRTAAYFYDVLMRGCAEPPGLGHLEDPELAKDLTVARDFDQGMSGPPLSIAMDFIASGLVLLVVGATSALVLFAFTWWAPLVLLAAWCSTHWLLRESAIWRDRETDQVRSAQQHADYAYRLAVDAPAAKELRLFGLSDWVIERFVSRRKLLHDLRWQATKLRERSLFGALAIVLGANLLVFWQIAERLSAGSLDLARAAVFLQSAVGVSAIAFGGLSWALDGASAPAVAIAKLGAALARAGALRKGDKPADRMPAREIHFRDVTFQYPGSERPVLAHFDLHIPAGSSLAIVGVNGAGKTTLAKLLCRLYDPTAGAIEIDGVDLRELDVDAWRARLTAVFQDFMRLELPLRDNVAPSGAPDEIVSAALRDAGAEKLASLDTILARGYEGGTDLSGGQWQRIALARALCAVRLGAGLVLLDEPTAQLDVRGEAEIFERVLEATRHCTTILVSHRFSTVRKADRICVLEGGAVVELGTHDELMSLGGRYRTMFDLQAARFVELDEQGQELQHDSLA